MGLLSTPRKRTLSPYRLNDKFPYLGLCSRRIYAPGAAPGRQAQSGGKNTFSSHSTAHPSNFRQDNMPTEMSSQKLPLKLPLLDALGPENDGGFGPRQGFLS